MIEIWTEVLPSAYWWKPDNYIGGTPEYAVKTAEHLVKLGYEVIVYYDNSPTEHNGVFYQKRSLYSGDDILIACNSKPPFMANKNIYWTSKYTDRAHDFMDFDRRITLSNYHHNIFGDSDIVPLACDPIKPKKKKLQAIYTSSPDRGLDFLLNIWPDVYNSTGLILKTSYGASCGQIGVFNLGKLSEKDMNDLYAESKFWLHPGQGIELFCISGYKAQVAGCIPVYVPTMALAETIKYGVETDLSNFKHDLIDAVRNKPDIPDIKYLYWDEVTNILDNIIKNI